MSNKVLPTLFPSSIPAVKFNLTAQEGFVKGRGVIFEHWAAIPSPIGMKEKGDIRRPEMLDTVSSNGFIYKKVGEFTGVIVNNARKEDRIEGGIYDNSEARLVLPKFYNDRHPSKTKPILFVPGDRIYAKDIELKVDNYQRVEYNPNGVDYLQFPAKEVSFLIDSLNNEFICGINYSVDKDGNIVWMDGKKNPGVDPDTSKGRIYGIRYTYQAFWYVSRLLNEIRITNTATNEDPARMPYQVMIQREYVYHNQTKSQSTETIKECDKPSRENQAPIESIDTNKYDIQVDTKNFKT
jgi:signal peptidase I